jgi:RNA polymerase sigma-70 factor, ECF subfamily
LWIRLYNPLERPNESLGSPMTDDQEVIDRVLAGDTEHFRILVVRYQGPLFGLVRNLIPDRGECEDIVQEVFLSAYTHLRSYNPRRSAFSTWLFTIARNKCVNALRKRRPRVVEDLPEATDHRSPDATMAEAELFRQLDVALATLPIEQKTAFVLAEIQGLSLGEISRIEGVNLGTVKSRVSRARGKLRSIFQRPAELP